MADYVKNGFEDDDALALLQDIEALEAKKESIMAAARGECAGVAKQIKNKLAEAKELNIPRASFNGWRKHRKLERQMQAIEASIPEEEIEVYLDGAGQFSFLRPADDEEGSEPSGDDEAAFDDEAEQAEGEEALNQVH